MIDAATLLPCPTRPGHCRVFQSLMEYMVCLLVLLPYYTISSRVREPSIYLLVPLGLSTGLYDWSRPMSDSET